jgi:hypothetical protein
MREIKEGGKLVKGERERESLLYSMEDRIIKYLGKLLS